MTARFRAGSATDIGQVRSSNQDACLAGDDLFVVADGMGGHNGGEVASQVAVETIADRFAVPTTDALVDAVQEANEAVIARAEEDPSLRGMGTTLVALAAVVTDGEDRLAVANVGDSRCYLLDGDRLRQITRDHSVVQTLVDNGQITAAEAEHHPQRNVLTRALGIDPRVMTDSWELLPFAGDRYLLCSDGLFNEVTEADIAAVLQAEVNPGDAAVRLVRMANEGGGRDNITAVVIDVVEDGGRQAAADAARSRVAQYTPGGKRAVVAAGAELPAPPDDDGGGDGAVGGEGGDDGTDDKGGKGRGISFRSIAFAGAIVAVVLTVVGVVAFASRGSYFVAFDDNTLVIYQGRPGGFLGMQPSVEERTGVARGDVPASYLDEIEGEKEFSSLDDARAYVRRIEAEIAQTQAPTRPPSDAPTVPSGDTPTTTALDGEAGPGDNPDVTATTVADGDGATDSPTTTEDDGLGTGGIGGRLLPVP